MALSVSGGLGLLYQEGDRALGNANINRELLNCLADLHRQVAWRGLLRSFLGLSGLIALAIWSVSAPNLPTLLWRGGLTGVFYASLFVTTHDALHHTLTGLPFWDELIPRLVSYPALWFHGLYKELHLIHHRANGNDLADPERPQFTREEYGRGSVLKRWYIRNQWFVDLFVLGGFGFIYHHVAQGLEYGKKMPRVRRALYSDLAGLLALNGTILLVTAHYGRTPQYLVLYLCLERITGLVHQFRSRVEHYGLWGKEALPLETQIYTSRNIATSPFVSFYFNGLNFHSIHHAFPRVPYYHLKAAHGRLAAWAESRGRPLPTARGYLRTAFELARHPRLIDDKIAARPATTAIG